MANNKRQAGGSSSSTMNFDHLFGPKDSSSTSSPSTGLFGSIFPPPSSVGGRESRMQEVGSKNFGAPGTQSNKGESSSGITNKNTSTNYQNETVEPSYFSSSIYYGGQENYSSRSRTTQPQHVFKKDKDDGDPHGNDSNSAARGNWWQGRSRTVLDQ
ncbi:Proteasome inhibitor-related protein [Spatholobus suberectus]|nr:Proteasome inhibitor-related protein [Spatholobus suberectus]